MTRKTIGPRAAALSPFTLSPFTIGAAAAAGLLAAGCGGDGSGDGSPSAGGDLDRGALDALIAELDAPEGGGVLTLTGHAEADGRFETGEGDDRYAGDAAPDYRPADDATNADGPYEIRAFADAVHPGSGDDPVRAWTSIVLPEGAGPGTYDIVRKNDRDETNAGAAVIGDGYGWSFTRVEEGGRIHVGEIGDAVTAAWEFTASDRDGETVQVSGAVRDLPFSPQAEYAYTLTVNGEAGEHSGRAAMYSNAGRAHTLALGSSTLILDLPEDIGGGEYSIRDPRQSDQDVTVTLPEHSIDEAQGTLDATVEDGRLSAEFTFTATGEEDIAVEGRFEQIELPG